VANKKTALDTSSAIATRSIASAGDATGGQANKRGITDQSLASSSGMAASPTLTWRPWVTAYSQAGLDGQSKVKGRSFGNSALRPSSGL
jgi:hypothetical protein